MNESYQHRFRASPTTQLSLGASQRLAHLAHADKAFVIDTRIAGILERCRAFRTLDAHAQEVCKAYGIDRQRLPEVVQALRELGERGLLVTLDDVLAAPPHEAPPAISTVGIITKDRPQALAEALVSYIEHCQHHGRDVEYVVCDDSESAVAREGCRELTRKLARRYQAVIEYAGREEKRHFAADLARASDVSPELVDFALFDVEGLGCSIGANRNALLLHGSGELMYSADDDTLCRVVRHPSPGARLELHHGDPFEVWCHPSREAALGSVSYDDRCLLTLHEELLGRSLSSILNGAAGEADYDGMCDHLLGALLGRKATVVITHSGILGDSGMHSGMALLAADGATHERIVRSEATYRSALTSREVLRVSRFAVSHGGAVAGAGLGLDLRAALPPFMPVARAEDSVFGAMVRMSDDCLFGYPEAAILHLPKDARTFPPNHAVAAAGKLRFADAILSLITEVQPGGRTMQALAERLISVGRLDEQRFEKTMKLALWGFCAGRCSHLEASVRARANSPAYWKKDVEACLSAVRASLTADDFWLATDLSQGRSERDTATLMRRLMQKFQPHRP